MNAGLERFFKNFSIFFKKSLKFLKALPLPFLDTQKSAYRMPRQPEKRISNFLNFFLKNPKVPQKAVVTGLDVAKKSRFVALFFDLKRDVFETCIPQETYAARAYRLICECLSDKHRQVASAIP